MGFVCTIAEVEEDLTSWGFDEPLILLSARHPYDPQDSGYIAYAISDFEDEGIARLSLAEEREFYRAASLVRSQDGFTQPFTVGFDSLSDNDGVWVFGSLQDGEFREFARAKRKK